jgi:xanthine dehydrogenase YagS FAD-binding subunit
VSTPPYVTIEDVLVQVERTLLVANDNNFPYGGGRALASDNTEFLRITLRRPLVGRAVARGRARGSCAASAATGMSLAAVDHLGHPQYGCHGSRDVDMNAFGYTRATSVDEALRLAQEPGTFFIAGGTNLLDLVKDGVVIPRHLVDVRHLPLGDIVELPNGGLRIGATARNADVANHSLVRARYPLLAQALLAGGSPQLRNMATTGGDLLQRTRCYYFCDTGFEHCNKRTPGSGCAAREGLQRIHAVLGASDACIATHPSDMCVALAALRADVRVRGPSGERKISMADFHRLPGDMPQRDTTLEPGELITAVELPRSAFAAHAHYLSVRDREGYAFALVSVAAALDIASDGVVRDAALALGGVAHKPWRVPDAERALVGHALTPASTRTAADALLQGARPYPHNAFKVELARRSVARALAVAAGLASEASGHRWTAPTVN